MKRIRSGFSLVELIVVIAIITSLTALGITSYSAVQRNARNTERKTDLKDLQVALEAYRVEVGSYPSTAGAWRGGAGCTAFDGAWGANYIPSLVPNFIDRLPTDPKQNIPVPAHVQATCRTGGANITNCYLYRSDGASYKLLAHCTPEGSMNANDPFADPLRTTWAWQVSSDATARTTW